MTRMLTTIGFDADDTLWHHEKFFDLTTARVMELVRPYAEQSHLAAHLHAAEKRNIPHYGVGVKGFILSLIESVIDVTDGKVPGSVIAQVLDAGREMLNHPVEPGPGVVDTLAALEGRYRLILITRGDLFDQERKLSASGLAAFFDEVEIVSDKTEPVYTRIFHRYGDGAERAMMIGNSLNADVLPALAAGAWAVHVPSETTWSLDPQSGEVDSPRFRRVQSLPEVLPIIDDIG